jgi:sulfoxide reductase heme-binding subunit YedZ
LSWQRTLASPWAKRIVFTLCLGPLAWLGWRLVNDDLGANPIEAIIRNIGDWGLRFLIASLAITPLRRLLGWTFLASYRRMIGLYAFAYVTLHLTTYIAIDQFFDWDAIWRDIVKRPYITIGMAAFALLLPLAITSTNKMVKRLGGKRWQLLHRAVYAAAIGGVVHYLLLVKADIRDPLTYIALLTIFLGYRVAIALRNRASWSAASPVRSARRSADRPANNVSGSDL